MNFTASKRTSRRITNRIIDFLMVLLLPFLMAYSVIGETFHEVTGTLMFALFILHLILHRNWWRAIPKGRYSAYRGFVTVLNLVLLILMFAQPLSGIAMSHHLYTFLPFTGVAATARSIHLVLAYWSYVLMSVHLGLHIEPVILAVQKGGGLHPTVKGIGKILFLLLSAYGIYAFIHRGLPAYMFMRTMFAFFDFEEPILYFIADYLSIMVLFATIGYYLGILFKTKRKEEILQ